MAGLVIALPGVMGSRLMIDVRSAYYRNNTELSPSNIYLHTPAVTDTPSELLELRLRMSTPVSSD